MSWGCSSKTIPRQVPNCHSKRYCHHKHNPPGLGPKVSANGLAVRLFGVHRGLVTNLVQTVRGGFSMVNASSCSKGLEVVLEQATFGELNKANGLLRDLLDESGTRYLVGHPGGKVSAITRNIRQRRCNYRRSIWQTVNRPGQQGRWQYFLKKF